MTNEQLLNRLKRAEGQLRGIQNMVLTQRTPQDVLIQLTAVRSTIDKTMRLILAANVQAALTKTELSPETQKQVATALALIEKIH
ncbi:metal-sensing transcriptional repressor [Loigolactobacillus rennini]|uniref:Metal-sensing transcriptional repressor n=1 Tax=Loigolactobacillus rennini DSM 20253 TaxID=1423796 RepID=A0A0R2D553_9LACO|nr:metal-sensing transcriptional repressor [Loigolactobacillus rennini]KRM98562.1 hypothetical protein FC24_GL001208 [Loigolactobacillus rennini DSM 20253]